LHPDPMSVAMPKVMRALSSSTVPQFTMHPMRVPFPRPSSMYGRENSMRSL
jgi:hypothetical protein